MQHRSVDIAGSRARIHYTVELTFDVMTPAEFIFGVHAAHTPQQHVVTESFIATPPFPVTVDEDPAFGNRIARLHAEPGPLVCRYAATVDVTHYMAEPSQLVGTPLAELPAETLLFLRASRYCQADQVQAMAWQEFGHLAPGYGQVDAVCAWVRNRTRFQPGTSGASTSALETLKEGVGVCRDFAHLTISILRALNYPARIVTGVDYGADPALGPPDFHAYVEAYMNGRWYLFDPTGISPLTGLIRIATGTDAADVSFATMFGDVRTSMPIVTFTATEDLAAGITLPEATTLAVSTIA